MLTYFSDEAHSIVANCTEVIQKSEEVNPYKVPPELAALEKKTCIFQLHYGSDSTKEQRFFFLDKAWDTTPLLEAVPKTDTEATSAKPEVEIETKTTPVQDQIDVTESSTTKSD